MKRSEMIKLIAEEMIITINTLDNRNSTEKTLQFIDGKAAELLDMIQHQGMLPPATLVPYGGDDLSNYRYQSHEWDDENE